LTAEADRFFMADDRRRQWFNGLTQIP